jgi:putative lipase involved disintegration of autophagic bodies
MKQTAVEWLFLNLKSHFEHDGDLLEAVQMSYQQAKEMERGHAQLYAIYCLTSIKENLPVIRFEDFIKLEGGDK